jgi:small subunit ribosomal protein S17
MEKQKTLSRQAFVGSVISDKMEKTLVVEVSRTYMHGRMDKVLRTTKRYKAHYEIAEGEEKAKVGDVVEIREGSPVSKTKYMYVTKVLTRISRS